MNRSSLLIVFIGILSGLMFGLLYGWGVNPVKYVDADPALLSDEYKNEYILLVATAYATDHNLERARQRFDLLQLPDLPHTIHNLIRELMNEGQEISTLVVLASSLNVDQTSEINLVSPLLSVEFPTETLNYPLEWPDEIHYPEEFIPVEVSFGTLDNNNFTGYAAKLRYAGNPQNAVDLLLSFFRNKGWEIVETTTLDLGGYLVLIERTERKSSGIIIIDPDVEDLEYTKVVITIFP